MTYDFKTLSPADFEDLARDIVGAELNIRLEGFAPGPDGGMDGRHACGGARIILQAKHKAGSTFSSLASVMRKEKKAIERIQPTRYILATSLPLSPKRKDALAKIVGPYIRDTGDILGCTELNSALRRHSTIERAHIKLWLSSTEVLERFLRSAAFSYTATSRDDMLAKLRVYVPNPSFAESRLILEEHKVLIVSGPPGVGKTTLAQMLSYAYVGDGWDFAAIQRLEDGFARIEDAKPTVFFFDDFLGKIRLDREALSARDTEFAQFLTRVRRATNARFILTTRAYIYEEARRVSDVIGDPRLNISKYVLNVGVYTRRLRARILYNHLASSTLPLSYVQALISTPHTLSKIVDHSNYNPRIVEWMTDKTLLRDVAPEEYATSFETALDHPQDIWDRAFREHIPAKGRHLLICLFFCSQYGEELNGLRAEFETTHLALCQKHNLPSSPTDFEDAIKLLEGSFIQLQDNVASFVNPSVRDYLNSYLNDDALLAVLAKSARSAAYARAIWRHYEDLDGVSIVRSDFAGLFAGVAQRFSKLPMWRTTPSHPFLREPHDLNFADRCGLLAEWYSESKASVFVNALAELVAHPPDSLSSWWDGPYLPGLIAKIRLLDDPPGANEMVQRVEDYLIELLRGSNSSEDLNGMCQSCEEFRYELSTDVLDTLRTSIEDEIRETQRIVDELDSKRALEEHAGYLTSLAAWAGIDCTVALSLIEGRLGALEEEKQSTPSFPVGQTKEDDVFDDASLISMFSTLSAGG